ncbi:signal peptidase I [Clavibacter michiganensis]|uniref:signal peptidase I n=1 Tax=Clavibacter michiganensis TaxID=28447 RepID=UPI0021585ED6|nr:signal peptidase I [Clavibacter michiganensis]
MSRHPHVVDAHAPADVPAPETGATAPRARRRRGPLARALTALGGIVSVVLALVVVAVLLLTLTGTARFVPVLSNSMAPGMPVGSLAVTQPVAREDVAVGDVVVFTAPVGPAIRVIHRAITVYGPESADRIDGWTPDLLVMETQGDNNPSPDPWIVTVSDDEVQRRTAVVPYLGWPGVWLSHPDARSLAFGAAGALVTAWALVAVWRRPPRTAEGRS